MSLNNYFINRKLDGIDFNSSSLFIEAIKSFNLYEDGYHIAADLLGYITNVKTLEEIRDYFIAQDMNSKLECYLEIIILGAAFCKDIPGKQRLQFINSFNFNNRAIKCAIIDALEILEEAIDIKEDLKKYLSDTDEYVRNQAEELYKND